MRLRSVSQVLLQHLFHFKFRLSTFYHFVAFIDISKEKETIQRKKEFNRNAELAAAQARFLLIIFKFGSIGIYHRNIIV